MCRHHTWNDGSRFQISSISWTTRHWPSMLSSIVLLHLSHLSFVCSHVHMHWYPSSQEQWWMIITNVFIWLFLIIYTDYFFEYVNLFIYMDYREGFTVINQDFMVHVTDLARFHCSQVDWSIGYDIGEPTFPPPPSGAVSLLKRGSGMRNWHLMTLIETNKT